MSVKIGVITLALCLLANVLSGSVTLNDRRRSWERKFQGLKNNVPHNNESEEPIQEEDDKRHPVIEEEADQFEKDPSLYPTIDQLVKKCVKVCMNSNQIKTCQFLCNQIETMRDAYSSESARDTILKKAKSIIDKIKALSEIVTMTTAIPILKNIPIVKDLPIPDELPQIPTDIEVPKGIPNPVGIPIPSTIHVPTELPKLSDIKIP